MQKRFGILRVLATIYKIFGVILGILTVLGAVMTFIGSIAGGSMLDMAGSAYGFDMGGAGVFVGLIAAVMILIMGGIGTVTVYGFGELLNLLIALEENTRATVIMLQSGSRPSMPPAPPMPPMQ